MDVVSYFLKSVGISDEPLARDWWIVHPEIVDGVFFSREPKPIAKGHTLIYYAVGRGCLCGVAEVLGAATRSFATPRADFNLVSRHSRSD